MTSSLLLLNCLQVRKSVHAVRAFNFKCHLMASLSCLSVCVCACVCVCNFVLAFYPISDHITRCIEEKLNDRKKHT